MNWIAVDTLSDIAGARAPRLLRFLYQRQVARAVAERAPYGLFLGEREAIRIFVEEEKIFDWSDVRNLADCDHDTLADFIGFNDHVKDALASQLEMAGCPYPLAQAFRYGFLASHSEDLPFWIAGFSRLIGERPPSEVVFAGGRSEIAAVLRAVCAARKIRVRELNSWAWCLLGAWGRVGRAIVHHHEVWSFRAAAILSSARGAISDTNFVLIYAKERSQRYLDPLAKALKSGGSASLSVGVGIRDVPGIVELIRESSLGVRFRLVRLEWRWRSSFRKAEVLMLSSSHAFRGVSIAPLHIARMRAVWNVRLLPAIAAFELAGDCLRRARPTAVVLSDPLEASYAFSWWCDRLKIETVFFYGIYNGLISTASLWEACIPVRKHHFAAMNEWLQKRLLACGADRVTVVGDLLRPPPAAFDKKNAWKEIERLTGLNEQKPLVVLLSRPSGSALSFQNKRILYESTIRAAERFGAGLLLKAHPYESQMEIRAILDHVGKRVPILVNECSLDSILALATLAVSSPASAAALEVSYAGVPLVLYGTEEQLDKLDRLDGPFAFRRHGAAMAFSEGEGLENGVIALLENSGMAQELVLKGYEFAQRISGGANAPGRLADFVRQVGRYVGPCAYFLVLGASI